MSTPTPVNDARAPHRVEAQAGAAVVAPRRRGRIVRLPHGVRRVLPRQVGHDERAPAVEHLEELRWRLVWCVSSIVVAFAAAYATRHDLFALLNRPLGGEFDIQTLGVTEPFFTSITVSAHAALVITFPLLVYHSWRYVSPAFEPWQRRSAIPYLVLAPMLFYSGVAFCYLFVLTPAVRFLLGLGMESFNVVVRAQEYYSFVATTMLAMGVVFLFPLALVGLARLGFIRADQLRSNRRLAFLGVAVVAAMLPTADPVSLLIEMLPMLALFELSIWLVAIQERLSGGPARARGDDDAGAAAEEVVIYGPRPGGPVQ